MLDKTREFSQVYGETTDGVRFTQDGNAYDNGGKFLFKVGGTPSTPPLNEVLDDGQLTRKELFAKAKAMGITVGGRSTDESIRNKIARIENDDVS